MYNDQGFNSVGIVIIIDSDFSEFFNLLYYLWNQPRAPRWYV